MNFIKSIIMVIIIAIVIGACIVFLPKFLAKNNNASSVLNLSSSPKSITTPTPIPTLPPIQIDESSNLKDEINKIEIPDFTENFESFKQELQ